MYLDAIMKIKYKLMLLISGVVALAVFPLSLLVLYQNQKVITSKTFEVCRNLSQNIAKASTEELLMGVTFDSTRSVIHGLKGSGIEGLKNAFVANHEGEIVAALAKDRFQSGSLKNEEFEYLSRLNELQMDETGENNSILRFSYPIFIEYKSENLRVGTAVFEFNKETVYRPIEETRSTIFYVSSIIFAIAILIAIITAVILTRPILRLADGARIIGEGNLQHKIDVSSTDEIGNLARSFNEMTEKINDFTNNLEAKVRQRTQELNETLEHVKTLKEQQDGDYFLTSLLTQPLQANNVSENSTVITDFVIKQKKKFSFKERHSEIGGDLCAADVIDIGNKSYSVVINADAMGKSIQGAGGTLVLGAAFKAHIIQSRLGKSKAAKPEIWLRDTYRDLQNIFVSFDGSMYISIMLGLIDQATGFFYFINAEHPGTILYRDGVASFIDDSQALRKLGTPGEDTKLQLRTFQIMPGDIIIAGSDGRDDLVMHDENGAEYINEDETQILKLVERAEGDVHKLVQLIKSTGNLMDDLSLLSIRYTGKHAERAAQLPDEVEAHLRRGEELLADGDSHAALEALAPFLDAETPFPDILRLMVRIYFQHKDFDSAVLCLEQLTQSQPEDDEALYTLSYVKGLQHDLESAADYGECLYLRNRYHKLNLLHLARVYYELGAYTRSQWMIEKLLELDPDHVQGRELFLNIQKHNQSEEGYDKKLVQLLKAAANAYSDKSWNRAAFQYREITTITPSNSLVWYRLGNCYLHNNRYEDAATAFRKAIVFDPSHTKARNNLAVAYFHLGELEQAKNQLKRVLKMNPDYSAAKKNLLELDEKLGVAA
ncbi:MAG: tetratricopeptide repeat protein [Leptospiraceae bacterium]|nr:tetratricopeptide repeat protein [Leptospiraceae bacterium]